MANSSLHPGVNVNVGAVVSPITGIATGISAILSNFSKGPLGVATLVTNLVQSESQFGVNRQVKAFFAHVGEAPLWIIRIASSSAAKATINFPDRQGAPADILQVDAINEGAWGNKLSVDIDDYNILTTTLASDISSSAVQAELLSVEGIEVGSYVWFDEGTDEYVTVTSVDKPNKTINWSGGLSNGYTAAGASIKTVEFSLKVYEDNILKETFDGISMRDEVSFFCEKKINDISTYITVEDLNAAEVDYKDQPAVTATPTALASGADGIADVTQSDYSGVEASKSGVYALDDVDGVFRFCVPDPILTDADVPAAKILLDQDMINYAELKKRTVEYYMDIPYNKSVADAITFKNNFASRYFMAFHPWLKVIESEIPYYPAPSSFAMGRAVEKDGRRGVHKSIGNEKILYAIDVVYALNDSEGKLLDDAGICTIRKFSGRGIRVYGDKSGSAESIWQFGSSVEYWNYVAESLKLATQDIPFEPNNADLWNTTIRRISAFFNNEQKKGAIFDSTNPTGPAYTVVMDSTNNSQANIANGIATATVTYVKTYPAAKFNLLITPSATGLQVAAV